MPSSVPASDPSSGVADLFINVQPSDVEFLEVLKMDIAQGGAVYKVKIDEKVCIMKVFQGQWENGLIDPDLEERLFLRESKAYRLLKKRGFCERGVVPDFYGTIERIDVRLWPDLYDFENPRFPPPDAVLLEYIPNAERVELGNYSKDNISRFSQVLRQFHEMGLLHGDLHPRNMLVVRQQPRDRVIWIDFDLAQIVQRGNCKDFTEIKFKDERATMDGFETAMAKYAATGNDESAKFYYS